MWILTLLLLADSSAVRNIPVAPAETLHVEESGTGTPVVLIPGFVGGTFTFRKIVAPLNAEGYRTIIIEPLGIGESNHPSGADYSLTAQADRMAAVFDTLGLSDVIVLAHSAAGSIGFRLAYRHPDLVGGLISIEGGPTEQTATPGFRRIMRFAPLIKLVGGVELVRWQIHRLLRSASIDTSWITDSTIMGYAGDAARDVSGTLDAFRAIANAHEPVKLAPHLAEVRCPVILMVGTPAHDGDVGADEVHLLAADVPHFTADTVPDAGHFLQEERPDAVLAAVTEIADAIPAPAR